MNLNNETLLENDTVLINKQLYNKTDVLNDENLNTQLFNELLKVKHREYCKVKAVSYRERSKDKINNYKLNNKDKLKEYQTNYRLNNKDKLKEYNKNYHSKTKTDDVKKKLGRPKKYKLDENFNLTLMT